MQACGIVKSWLSNGRHLDGFSEPSFEGTVSIQGNANVISRKCRGKRGVDTGMVKILTDSRGESWGSLTDKLKSRVEKDKEIQVRKQKLNACLRAKKKPTVSLVNGRTERWVRNISGRAINEMVAHLAVEPIPPIVILEKLLASEMKFKSRAGNRMLKASQLGYIGKRTRASLDLAGLLWKEVNPASNPSNTSNILNV